MVLRWLSGRGRKGEVPGVRVDEGPGGPERRRGRTPERPWTEDPQALDNAAMIGGIVFGVVLYLGLSLLASGGP